MLSYNSWRRCSACSAWLPLRALRSVVDRRVLVQMQQWIIRARISRKTWRKPHRTALISKSTTSFQRILLSQYSYGVRRYFDNVGGWMLDEVIVNMKPHGIVGLCGRMSCKFLLYLFLSDAWKIDWLLVDALFLRQHTTLEGTDFSWKTTVWPSWTTWPSKGTRC